MGDCTKPGCAWCITPHINYMKCQIASTNKLIVTHHKERCHIHSFILYMYIQGYCWTHKHTQNKFHRESWKAMAMSYFKL